MHESAETARAAFQELQQRLPPLFDRILPDRLAPRTVVVVPSLTLDAEELAKVDGVHHYEERLLCLLMLLRLPATQVIYVTSEPIPRDTIEYHLHLLSGIPYHHSRRRLQLFHCHDRSLRPLTRKLLDRPRVVERIRAAVRYPEASHLVCFNTTALERELAIALDMPLFGCDPDLAHLGTKSHSREILRESGVIVPPGHEHLRDEDDIVEAIDDLAGADDTLERVVIKLNDGFSGEGNALLRIGDAPTASTDRQRWLHDALRQRTRFESEQETWEHFSEKFSSMQGVVETFVEGDRKTSPSVQVRLGPGGQVDVLSTHDQVLGGPGGQVFKGCTFPAASEYRREIHDAGARIGRVLADRGVIGRFSADFVSTWDGDRWQHFGLELNLRKGGTTHPYLMLEFLTDGAYDDTGVFRIPTGPARCYYATDNLEHESLRGLLPHDLIDIAVRHQLHYHSASQTGVVFHLLGTLSEFGKLGAVCIAETEAQARALFATTQAVLLHEAHRFGQ